MLKLVSSDSFGKRKPASACRAARSARRPFAASIAKRPKVSCSDEDRSRARQETARGNQFELMDLQQDLGLNLPVVHP